MSSLLKKYRKNVIKHNLEFDVDMYNNIYGSFGIAYYRCFSLLHDKESAEELKSRYREIWKRMQKRKVLLPFLDNPAFVDEMCKVYGIADFPYGSIALVKGTMNSLFAPCYVENNRVQILPLREDGEVGVTLTFGKPYVILKDEEQTTENKPSDA